MKKYISILTVLFVLIGNTVIAQETEKKIKKVQKGDLVEATYYYADGSIQQQGTFNKKGELHGVWTSYDTKGNKIALGNYVEGKKEGKWIFWVDKEVKEVNYVNSKITEVLSSNRASI